MARKQSDKDHLFRIFMSGDERSANEAYDTVTAIMRQRGLVGKKKSAGKKPSTKKPAASSASAGAGSSGPDVV